jgi:alkylation response protein AidB-like acyl-CoA dehydrogenase
MSVTERRAPPADPLRPNPDALALERALGSPYAGDGPLSFAGVVRADETEQPQTDALQAIHRHRGWSQLVPITEGGRLGSFEQVLAVNRVVSRRDLTVAVSLGSSFLASMPVWIWGNERQRQLVAEMMLNGRFGCLAVSEREAGSDLLATSCRADPSPDGYVLDGEKWLIGNGSRASFITALARAAPSFGLFLFDRDRVDPASVRSLAKIRTLGLRAHDMSGLRFDGCRLPPTAPVGRVGRGIEMLTGALQFTRTLIAGLSLGAADTALRVATGWARERVLYGRPIIELPAVRDRLLAALGDLLTAECVAAVGARGLNVALPRMALWSPQTKYIAPQLCEQSVRDSAEVLSARYYLREGVAAGVVQKIARDVTIAAIFEGTQAVQLETVLSQLLHAHRRGPDADAEPVDAGQLFGLGRAVPPWDGTPPALAFGGHDEILDALGAAHGELAELPRAQALVARFIALRTELGEQLAAAAGSQARSGTGHELARRHCVVHAAACCAGVWLHNRNRLGHAERELDWLALCLGRLARLVPFETSANGTELDDALIDWLVALHDGDRLFSLTPFPLADAPAARR